MAIEKASRPHRKKKVSRTQQKKTVSLADISVCVLGQCKTLGQEFLPEGTFTVILDYPIDRTHRFEVEGPMTAYDVAVRIGHEYSKKIYKNDETEEFYGVWGHSIEDLVVESLTVNLQNNTVIVGMGS